MRIHINTGCQYTFVILIVSGSSYIVMSFFSSSYVVCLQGEDRGSEAEINIISTYTRELLDLELSMYLSSLDQERDTVSGLIPR